jgi:hypothetical protein
MSLKHFSEGPFTLIQDGLGSGAMEIPIKQEMKSEK